MGDLSELDHQLVRFYRSSHLLATLPARALTSAQNGVTMVEHHKRGAEIMTPQPITENTMFYGDNLDILRQYIADNSIDLVYLDRRLTLTEAIMCFLRQIAVFEDS